MASPIAPSHAIGHWLPKDRGVIKEWLASKLKELEETAPMDLGPSLVKLQAVVNADPTLRYQSQAMFTQIPPAYIDDPTGQPQVKDFNTMLSLVNLILLQGPQWFYTTNQDAMGLIGFPINAILDWPMGTNAGYCFFLNVQVNVAWGNVLSTWGTYLASPPSVQCLNENSGWLSPKALDVLAAKGNDGTTNYTFDQLYECDPQLPYYGFRTWDDFFTRKFKPGIRPVAYPDDIPTPEQPFPKKVITNACESGPLQFVENVKRSDLFWIKNQPYSLSDVLNNDPLVDQFVGGSVYQAFLSALSYHCWNAPVSGYVVKIEIVPGTYYSESLFYGFADPDGPDPNAPNNCQPYITAVATRGIIYIQADDPTIGLMAIVFVGMAEVSSCVFTVKKGDRLTKGQLIGAFHFGGSTHCMVFRPQTTFLVKPPNPPTPAENNLPVNGVLAVVT